MPEATIIVFKIFFGLSELSYLVSCGVFFNSCNLCISRTSLGLSFDLNSSAINISLSMPTFQALLSYLKIRYKHEIFGWLCHFVIKWAHDFDLNISSVRFRSIIAVFVLVGWVPYVEKYHRFHLHNYHGRIYNYYQTTTVTLSTVPLITFNTLTTTAATDNSTTSSIIIIIVATSITIKPSLSPQPLHHHYHLIHATTITTATFIAISAKISRNMHSSASDRRRCSSANNI